MSRSLVLGNGSVMVGIDRFGEVRDFYFDYVGLENHMSEDSVNKIGVWVDGAFSWLSSGEWNMAIDYRHETLSGVITAVNERLGVELTIIDLVYNEKPIFLRKFTVRNKFKQKRTIKVFLNHQFRMYGAKKGDTVYFDPNDNTIIHYKGRRLALISGQIGKTHFTDYSVGLSNIEGKEGTWKDAEDGVLTQNPVEHGTVDSTIGFEETVDSEGSFNFTSWVIMAKTIQDAKDTHKYILEKSPDHLFETTQDFWHAWITKNDFPIVELDKNLIELFKKSLFILRTHIDNTGAILASGDSDMLQNGRDNYSYVWPRDAAFIAMAMDNAGYPEVSRKFFEFANAVISEHGYFYHKYRPDKSMGSSWHPWVFNGKPELPIQEDETAIVLVSLWRHYEKTKDLEFIEDIYNSLIKKSADFLISYRNERQLPLPSYDLWEMKYGIHTYTVASVYGALSAASLFADLLGKNEDTKRYYKAAKEVKESAIEHLFNKKRNYYYKLVECDDHSILHDETIDISSFYGMYRFGVLAPNDSTLEKAYKNAKEILSVGHERIGVARFENDVYYRECNDCTGNSWFITTLWVAQYLIEKAQKSDELDEAYKILQWTAEHALPSGVLSEQIDPRSGNQTSAAPLAWSHAEFITTVLEYIEKKKVLKNG